MDGTLSLTQINTYLITVRHRSAVTSDDRPPLHYHLAGALSSSALCYFGEPLCIQHSRVVTHVELQRQTAECRGGLMLGDDVNCEIRHFHSAETSRGLINSQGEKSY